MRRIYGLYIKQSCASQKAMDFLFDVFTKIKENDILEPMSTESKDCKQLSLLDLLSSSLTIIVLP